jgi:Uma2 family endonuclease
MPRTSRRPAFETMAELLERLGGVAPERVRLDPPPGRATERHLIRLNDRSGRLYELIDGVLVEKAVSYPESNLAAWLIFLLQEFLQRHDLGLVAGEGGGMRLMQGLVRLPDVSFVRWERLPSREVPMDPIAGLGPDLAVEVLSPSNTRGEMERKLREYFLSGTRLVWLVDLRKRRVVVHTDPDQGAVLAEGQTLDGGDVLPGLALPVGRIFERLPRIERPAGEKASPSRSRKKRGEGPGG